MSVDTLDRGDGKLEVDGDNQTDRASSRVSFRQTAHCVHLYLYIHMYMYLACTCTCTCNNVLCRG